MFNYEKNKISYIIEGKVLGVVFYSRENEETVNIYNVYVEPMARGKGISSILLKETLSYFKSNGYKVNSSCSFATNWIEKHTTGL